MATFTYRGIDPDGKVQTGEIEADNEDTAVSRLQSAHVHVISLSSTQQKSRSTQVSSTARSRRVRVKLEDLAMMSRQLAIMIDSGVPVVESLGSIAIQVHNQAFRRVLTDVQQQVIQGHSLSQALSRYPSVFSDLYVDMVKMAETGGDLGQVIGHLAGYLESNLDIIRKVKSAMMYPTIIIIASVITVIALVTFILPRFTKLFKDMGVQLPTTTRILLMCSNFMINYWYIALGGLILILLAVKAASRTLWGKRLIDWSKLHAPLVGDLVRKVVLSRSLLALGTLLSGGVPLVTALETAAGAAGNVVIGAVYRFTRTSVETGSTIADAFKTSKEFPPLVVQITAVGERAGELPNLLLRISRFYSEEADTKIKGLTSIIEPVLIVVLGAVIGFIAVSIISPIYTLVGNVPKH